MDTHFTGDDKNDNIVDVEYTKLMGHLDLSKLMFKFLETFILARFFLFFSKEKYFEFKALLTPYKLYKKN